MSRVAVTGSSGLIGRALCERLAAAGHEVARVFRGNPTDPSAWWNPETRWVRPGAFSDCDAIVHLAGSSLADGRWSAARKKELVASRVEGTRLLIDHLATLERRPAAFLAASGVGYYGLRGSEELTEESAKGRGFLADLVEAWERETVRAADLGMRTVRLRFGVVLDESGGALKKMLLPFKLGAGGRIASGRQYMALVSLEDATRAIQFALENPVSGAFNVAIPEPVTNARFTKALGGALHRPTLIPIPGLGLKLLFGAEQANEMLLDGQRARPRRLLEAGFAFSQPTVEDVLRAAL